MMDAAAGKTDLSERPREVEEFVFSSRFRRQGVPQLEVMV